MRLSVDPEDDAFDLERAKKYRVLLNGEPVQWITADDVKGEAKVTVFTASGRPDTCPLTGKEWVVWRTGVVQFCSKH